MPTHRLQPQPVLDKDAHEALDAFCASHSGVESLEALAGFLQERYGVELSLDPDVVAGFAEDSSHLPGAAQALARPQDETGCAAVLRVCTQAKIPITVSAGRSSLTGSATPRGGVVLSTSRMLTPAVEVDASGASAKAPVGLLLEDMRKAVREQTGGEKVFSVDPTSRGDATVGGCVACNASGFTPGESGAMRDWVRSVRFLLPNGTVLEAERGAYVSADGAFVLAGDGEDRAWPVPTYARPAIKNAGGPFSSPDGTADFVDLVVGSEGLFGLVTACTLGLANRPDGYLDLFFSLPGEAEALRLLTAARERFHGDLSCVSAFEYFGVHCRAHMDHEGRFFRSDDPVGMYIQEPLFDKDMEDAAEVWLEVLAEAELDVDEDAMLLLDTDALRDLFLEARPSDSSMDRMVLDTSDAPLGKHDVLR